MDNIKNENVNKYSNLSAKLEAVLFTHGEPVAVSRLAELVDASDTEVEEGLKELLNALESQDRGISLMLSDGKAVLTTLPALGELVKKLTNEELDSELTPASLETLSLIAYLGPVSKAEIEYIRGVNSSFILRSLMVRGLVGKVANKERPGSFVYNVTFDFLRHMGVGSPEELPDRDKYKNLLKDLATNKNDQ